MWRQPKTQSEYDMKKQTQTKSVQGTTPRDGAAVQPTTEAIAKRAHEIYLARGSTHGSDLDDWLQAERELKADPQANNSTP